MSVLHGCYFPFSRHAIGWGPKLNLKILDQVQTSLGGRNLENTSVHYEVAETLRRYSTALIKFSRYHDTLYWFPIFSHRVDDIVKLEKSLGKNIRDGSWIFDWLPLLALATEWIE